MSFLFPSSLSFFLLFKSTPISLHVSILPLVPPMFQIKKHDLQGLLWNTRLHIPSRDSPREKFISQPESQIECSPIFEGGEHSHNPQGIHEGTPLRNGRRGLVGGRKVISWGDASLYKVISMILKLWERFDSTEAISGGLLMIGRVEIYLARKFNVLEEEISVLAYFPSMLGNRNRWIISRRKSLSYVRVGNEVFIFSGINKFEREILDFQG